ncbi:MAG: nucleotide exchange factor GrpE [Desulfocapsa sp.]|uniref:Protein GrpE n=1 Tax=Desulfotalea psychrophila TaxID=84980 RepID=A0ABS3AUE2_9BACT|nr:nucleotide exchange factor GrpE [Desulfocapsa sp.]MBN4068371.1 nucleotide exchange factor GrpE [Desulfotalea psychrophila]
MEDLVSEDKKQEQELEGVKPIGEGRSGAGKIAAADAVEKEEGKEKSLEEQLADALADAAEQKDLKLRLAAEFENYKKRMMREKITAMKYAGEPVLREILATVDNLERAIDQGQAEGVEAEQRLSSLLEGVQLTLKSLMTTLEKFEVKPIESMGKPFDPTNHEALTMEPSDTVPVNHILNVFEKGYQYKDRLLRAAKVIVSAGDKE